MTEITRPLLATLRDEMNAALAEVAKKHGITISLGNASFSPSQANFKLLVVGEAAEDGQSASDIKAAADLKTMGKLYGADPSWAGKTFTSPRGGSFTVVGLLPSRTKRCILANRADGKPFVFEPEIVAQSLARS